MAVPIDTEVSDDLVVYSVETVDGSVSCVSHDWHVAAFHARIVARDHLACEVTAWEHGRRERWVVIERVAGRIVRTVVWGSMTLEGKAQEGHLAVDDEE